MIVPNDIIKRRELDRLWSRILQLDKEISAEAVAQRGRISARYRNLKQDMKKLKAEYEKVKGGGSYNPNNAVHRARASKRSFMDQMLGRAGADSHFKLE